MRGTTASGCRGDMQKSKRGLAAALLCVLIFMTGCSGEQDVYQAGWESETTGARDEKMTKMFESASDAGTVQAASPETETDVPAGYVYVCGAVNQPGVYPVTEDMRLFEAVAMAGGFSVDADEQWLNQASRVCDGQRVYVYTLEETRQMAQNGSAGQTADTFAEMQEAGADTMSGMQDGQQKVNLNTAGREELMTLPGIGRAKADAIVQYRTEHGSFKKIEEIQNISGIKEAVFAKIRDYITV